MSTQEPIMASAHYFLNLFLIKIIFFIFYRFDVMISKIIFKK
jgi:hypothetical protein